MSGSESYNGLGMYLPLGNIAFLEIYFQEESDHDNLHCRNWEGVKDYIDDAYKLRLEHWSTTNEGICGSVPICKVLDNLFSMKCNSIDFFCISDLSDSDDHRIVRFKDDDPETYNLSDEDSVFFSNGVHVLHWKYERLPIFQNKGVNIGEVMDSEENSIRTKANLLKDDIHVGGQT